jgi:Xaa-Pro aminopeptidase
LIVRSGKNLTYLSGVSYPGTLARHVDLTDSPRPILLIWPRHGNPTIVVNSIAQAVTERDSWISDLEVISPYGQSSVAAAAEVLKRDGLLDGRLGVEKTYLGAAQYDKLCELAPGAELLDCESLMDSVRWIKTEAEIALLEEAADLQDEAFVEVFSSIRPGDTEREIHSRMVASCIRRGCEFAHGILHSHRTTGPYCGEGDVAFEPGDIVRTDYVSYLRGYPGHQSRLAVLGRPSDEQVRTYGTIRDIYLKTIDACRVGVSGDEIYQLAKRLFRDQGIDTTPLALVGHSVGPWWHQQDPHLISGCQTKLEAGMVLALEPHVNFWQIQDMALITDDGPRLLSDRFDTESLFAIEG